MKNVEKPAVFAGFLLYKVKLCGNIISIVSKFNNIQEKCKFFDIFIILVKVK